MTEIYDFIKVNRLVIELENQLEEIKLYVGMRQTKYEYKHKKFVDTIYQIDYYINALTV